MTRHIIVMTSHGVSVSYHSILDQGQALCISKILSYQPQHPTTHILNHVHQHEACNRTHTVLHTRLKLHVWEICELCMILYGNTQAQRCARAHTQGTQGVHTEHGHIRILISSMPPAYLYLWLGRIGSQVWISFGNPTNQHISLRFVEYEYELVNHLRLWEDSTKHTLENIAQPKEDVAMPLTCVSRRFAIETVKSCGALTVSKNLSSTWGRCDNSQVGWYLCATRPGCVFFDWWLMCQVEARLVAMDLTIR